MTEIWISPPSKLPRTTAATTSSSPLPGMKPDIRLAAAQDDFDAVANRLSRVHPAIHQSSRVLLVPLEEEVIGDVRQEIFLP